MNDRIITLCYRKIIDAHSERSWEKLLFEDTYKEFKMQFQLFNQAKKHFSFSELLHAVPPAQQLHFLVSAAATGYVQQLGDKIPDIKNNLGLSFLLFKNFRFEIIQSDIRNKSLHAIALNFITGPYVWLDTIGNSLLLANPDSMNKQSIKTDMLTMQPFVSVYSIQNGGI